MIVLSSTCVLSTEIRFHLPTQSHSDKVCGIWFAELGDEFSISLFLYQNWLSLPFIVFAQCFLFRVAGHVRQADYLHHMHRQRSLMCYSNSSVNPFVLTLSEILPLSHLSFPYFLCSCKLTCFSLLPCSVKR